VLWNLLGSKAALLVATDTFIVSFSAKQGVQLFAQCNSNPTFEYVMTLKDESSSGNTVAATVTILPGASPLVQNISFQGEGGCVNSRYSIGTITSTGTLGDVTVGGSLGGISAASIFGNIMVNGGAITGTIQTTGIDINPFTGATMVVNANLGQFIYNSKSAVTGVTTIYAWGGLTSTGQIISRGNLLSSVVLGATFNGLIAAQGNIGAILTNTKGAAVTGSTGQLTRYGGISVSGNMSGQIIALGNIFGDLVVGGSLTGRIAAQGQTVSGLSATRTGILGNIRINNGFASTAAIVSGGLIGDAMGQTTFQAAGANGLLAADGAINLAKTTTSASASLFSKLQGSANGAVLNAIFTGSSLPLSFDTGGSLQGLALIVTDLNNITVTGGQLTGTNP
jgi:hypothetical protein